MIYPKFLKKEDVIGITAPSSGVGDEINNYEKSIKTLKEEYHIIETKNVRNKGIESSSSLIRAKEFNELLKEDVSLILIARGGEFLYDCLEYLELNNIRKYPKWIMGYSDPTSILFYLTTKYDIATIYGFNSTSYLLNDKCINVNLNIIKGNLIVQQVSNFIANRDNLILCGRMIGGCIDVLKDLIGTPFCDIDKFNKKYCKDGIIWYFDVCNMSAEDFYLTLVHFNYSGWFKNVKGVLLSKINSKQEKYITYESALNKVFGNIVLIREVSFGHVFPRLTIINGSTCKLKISNNTMFLEFNLK